MNVGTWFFPRLGTLCDWLNGQGSLLITTSHPKYGSRGSGVGRRGSGAEGEEPHSSSGRIKWRRRPPSAAPQPAVARRGRCGCSVVRYQILATFRNTHEHRANNNHKPLQIDVCEQAPPHLTHTLEAWFAPITSQSPPPPPARHHKRLGCRPPPLCFLFFFRKSLTDAPPLPSTTVGNHHRNPPHPPHHAPPEVHPPAHDCAQPPTTRAQPARGRAGACQVGPQPHATVPGERAAKDRTVPGREPRDQGEHDRRGRGLRGGAVPGAEEQGVHQVCGPARRVAD
ncbi:hypothetical protein DFP73DRAFT_607608 [Morchella snyderi]|nr:hypothetical protein DFP73DRAFT_607608 [Morchella snyderi]